MSLVYLFVGIFVHNLQRRPWDQCDAEDSIWSEHWQRWSFTPSIFLAMLVTLMYPFFKDNIWKWRWAFAQSFYWWTSARPSKPVQLNYSMVLATFQLSFRVMVIFLYPKPSFFRATILFFFFSFRFAQGCVPCCGKFNLFSIFLWKMWGVSSLLWHTVYGFVKKKTKQKKNAHCKIFLRGLIGYSGASDPSNSHTNFTVILVGFVQASWWQNVVAPVTKRDSFCLKVKVPGWFGMKKRQTYKNKNKLKQCSSSPVCCWKE